MQKKTLIPVIILSALVLLSIWVFFSNDGEAPPVPEKQTLAQQENSEKAVVKDIIITETNEGKKFWDVVADSGEYDKTSSATTLYNINGNFYKDGKVVLSVQAPVAIYNSEKKEVILKNGAKAANNKNVIITAKQICWAGTTDTITATGNVKIVQDDKMMTTSDKSVFDSEFTYLNLDGNSDSYVYK